MIANIVDGETLDAFPLRSGYLLSLHLFSITLEVLARVVKQEKWNRRHPDCKEEIKLFFVDDVVLHTENPKESTEKLLGS